MSVCTVEDWKMPEPCEGCGDPLSPIAQEHGTELGHEGLCCACYEQHQAGELRRAKRKRRRR